VSDGEVLYGVGTSWDVDRELRRSEAGSRVDLQEPIRAEPLMRIEDHFKETLEQHEPNLSDRGAEAVAGTLGRWAPPTASASTRTSFRAHRQRS